MKILILSAVLLVSVSIVDTTNDAVSNSITNLLMEILENVRREEVSRFDPYIHDKPINERIKGKGNDIKIGIEKYLTVVGASNLTIKNLRFILKPDLGMELFATIVLPHVKIYGNYQVDGKAAKFIPIRGKGKMELIIHKFVVNLQLAIDLDGLDYEAKNIQLSIESDKIIPHFENLIDENLAPIINSLLKMFSKNLVDRFIFKNGEIMRKLKFESLKAINKQITKYNAKIYDLMVEMS